MEKYYITTAIPYTSAKPHIGNTYEAVLADAIARYKRLKGFDVLFQTGTDEHGEKISKKAAAEGLEEKAFVDKIVGELKEEWKAVNTSYDTFVRTTDEKHKNIVKKIYKKLYDQKDIYLDKYEGLYCVDCEAFFTKSQAEENKCPDCNRELEERSEEAYFLNLKKYQERLIKHIEDNPNFISPESRKNEIVNNFIKPGLQDLCISRTSFTWGIDIDFAPGHVAYVWIDALSNYITNIGYDPDGSSEEFNKWWPADLHVVGKDIMRFHAIYWPIILMALDLELPKQIFGHPWLLFNDDKMSKSKGNILYASDLVKEYGVDAIRYYVLREIPYANDGSLTHELLIERNNSDLANNLGNLVNRTIAMSHKYFEGKVKYSKIRTEHDEELIKKINQIDSLVENQMDELKVASALDKIFELLSAGNKYIDQTEPWLLAKDENNKERLSAVLYNLLELIRVSALELRAFLPDTSESILKQINNYEDECSYLEEGEYNCNEASVLFARIDKEKKLKEIYNE